MKKLQQWLAECYHDFRIQTGSSYVLDYAQLVLFTEQQFLRSWLGLTNKPCTRLSPIEMAKYRCLENPNVRRVSHACELFRAVRSACL